MTGHVSSCSACERAAHAPMRALDRLLDELITLLMGIDPEVYVSRPVPAVSGSVGEHVRHTIDHMAALLASDGSTPLSYDHRARGRAVEFEPGAALQEILRLKAALERSAARTLDEPIQVKATIAASGETVVGWSTLARELAFVMSHTIHHQAIVALLLERQGIGVSDRFGYSASTPARR
jgi:uncharacterized damage-inducible protein DinB